MPIRTTRRYALYIEGDRVFVGTWRRCMLIALRFPDKRWEIKDDKLNIVITENYGVKE